MSVDQEIVLIMKKEKRDIHKIDSVIKNFHFSDKKTRELSISHDAHTYPDGIIFEDYYLTFINTEVFTDENRDELKSFVKYLWSNLELEYIGTTWDGSMSDVIHNKKLIQQVIDINIWSYNLVDEDSSSNLRKLSFIECENLSNGIYVKLLMGKLPKDWQKKKDDLLIFKKKIDYTDLSENE